MAIDIRQVCRQYAEEFWGKGDASVLDRICDPARFTLHEPIEGDLDAEGTKRNMKTFRDAFPDATGTLLDIVVEGNRASLQWRFEGTFKKPLYGIAPTNQRVQMEGVSLVRFDGEKLVEETQLYDGLGLFQRLGVIPRIEDLARQGVRPQP